MSIAVANNKLPRYALFVALNVAAVLLVVVLLVAPLLSYFGDRSEAISDNAAQLAHFEKAVRDAKVSSANARRGGNPFLSGEEERIASADMQANLKAMAANAGVNLRGIRGLPPVRSQKLQWVPVSVEVEGTLKAVRDMIVAIEAQTPLMFVTAFSFRSMADGEDGPIRAEFKVQGAMRDPSSGKEAVAP